MLPGKLHSAAPRASGPKDLAHPAGYPAAADLVVGEGALRLPRKMSGSSGPPAPPNTPRDARIDLYYPGFRFRSRSDYQEIGGPSAQRCGLTWLRLRRGDELGWPVAEPLTS